MERFVDTAPPLSPTSRNLPMGIGWQEILIFLVIVMLLFGSARLPSLMRNLGRSAVEFKKGMRDDEDEPSVDPNKP